MSKHGANISTVGITNTGRVTPPKTIDKSDSMKLKVHSGARINKVSPGLNMQIVPLVTMER